MRSILLLLPLLLLLLHNVRSLVSGDGISTHEEHCFGPVDYEGASVPRMCSAFDLEACGSQPPNFTITADGKQVYTAPVSTDWVNFDAEVHLNDDDPDGCVVQYALGAGVSDSTLSNTFVRFEPVANIICAGNALGSNPLPIYQLGADCSALSCGNCTENPLCGWCSYATNFVSDHETNSWRTFEQLSNNGRCIARAPSSPSSSSSAAAAAVGSDQPWCFTCALTYALSQEVCPVYTGSTPGEDPADRGGLGGQTQRTLVVVLVILGLLAVGCFGFFLWQQRRRARQLHTGEDFDALERYGETVQRPRGAAASSASSSSYVPPSEAVVVGGKQRGGGGSGRAGAAQYNFMGATNDEL